MSLFTTPLTLNNGADHIFTFRSQLFDTSNKKSIIGEYIEAAADIEDESKFVVKHDSSSSTVRRRLLQRRCNYSTTSRGLRPITVNFTIAYDVEHSSTDVLAEIALVKDALAEATFGANLVAGYI